MEDKIVLRIPIFLVGLLKSKSGAGYNPVLDWGEPELALATEVREYGEKKLYSYFYPHPKVDIEWGKDIVIAGYTLRVMLIGGHERLADQAMSLYSGDFGTGVQVKGSEWERFAETRQHPYCSSKKVRFRADMPEGLTRTEAHAAEKPLLGGRIEVEHQGKTYDVKVSPWARGGKRRLYLKDAECEMGYWNAVGDKFIPTPKGYEEDVVNAILDVFHQHRLSGEYYEI